AGDYDVYHWYSATRSPAVVFANTNRAYQSVETAEVEMDDPAAAEAAAGKTLHLGVVAEDKRILARRGDEVRAADLANWRAEGIEKVTVVTAVREDSVAKMKRELLKDARFRQALSLSMDREEIIKAEFLDRKRMGDSVLSEQIIPAQLAPGRESRFHSEKLMTAFSEFDLPRANALLDEIGLTRRDTEGMRTLPDGSPLTIYLYTTSDYFANVGITELMIEQWRRAGLRVVLRDRARPLFNAERATLVHDLSLWTGESEFNPLSTVRSFVPTELYSWQAPGYGVWYERGGAWDNPAAQLAPGAVAPPEDSPLREAQRLFTQVQQTVDPAEQARLVQKILDEYNAPYCWGISVCTPPPQPVVVARGLRGVPGNALVGAALATPANAGPETFWFEKDTNSPDARARISRSMIEIRMDGASAAGEAGGVEVLAAGGGWLGRLVMWLLIGSLLLMLALAAFRHPFVLRRLAIMLPTLLVVSVVAFVIIQLPPSDFLETRIADLRMQGDEASARTVEDLKRVFHTEESQLSRYLRWTGLTWFTTFDSDDRGLLQGDLGRSMEDSRPVMEVVSDRIILTVAVSAATIVFTWVTALTIGIFSAVRQYSLLDYVFTSVGFVGMSVPNFLLALLLMHWGNVWFGVTVTGLFSPDYADEPWSRAKLIDLARHIWLPVVVLGVAGTAGMIRVMRANLLDELRKPYVTTARARGVRPIRLLLKYPVRIALNPFISGIGHLFPALVSGGAIVSMVLSLPMVGPKMIYALQNEDMYLAGSLLMVLSLLGICGTLVSDLLLLWLDPRVRMEGGGER
ncbi:MAG: ABC transporter permease subunit, partial [Phycisphaeraceae bacterium]